MCPEALKMFNDVGYILIKHRGEGATVSDISSDSPDDSFPARRGSQKSRQIEAN